MQVQKAVKFRLYPKQNQLELLSKHFGSNRFIYNHFLAKQIENHERGGKYITYVQMAKMLTDLKKQDEYIWLNEIAAQSMQQTLKHLDTAFQRFFKKIGKFPKFKSKHDNNKSYKVVQSITFDLKKNTVKIPKFDIKFKFRGSFTGVLVKTNSVTISQTPDGKIYASLQGMFDIPEKESNGTLVGVDLGLTHLLIDSHGNKFDNPKFYKKSLGKLKYLQRQTSKKTKGSKSRNKSRIKLAKQYQKVSNQRTNNWHKISSKLVDENQVIATESLNIKGMVKNHKLAGAISDAAWGEFIRQLEYKSNWYNRKFVKIDQWFASSKTCSCCGHKMAYMPLNVRDWACPSCGVEHDRDINAAQNILVEGLRILSLTGVTS